MQQIAHDVLILGTGLAGLRAAVEICIKTGGKANIGIISKYIEVVAGRVFIHTDDIIHSHRGQLSEFHPLRAAIETDEESKLRSGKEQFGIFQVFPDNLHGPIVRKVSSNAGPRFSCI